MDLHAVGEVGGEHRLERFADVGMAVAEAGEPLARVEVEVLATLGVIQVRAAGVHEPAVEADHVQHVDQRRIQVPRGQRVGLLGPRERLVEDPE